MLKKLFGSVFMAAVVGVTSSGAVLAGPPPGNTIVDIAVGNPNFSTLTAAVVCTGLAPALSGKRMLTVFAPTDAAFAKLSLNKDNVCSALPKKTLTNILLYHVTKGKKLAADVLAKKKLRMLNHQTTKISVVDGKAFINDAQIVATDIMASNGVIHVIDTVLMPKAKMGDDDDKGQKEQNDRNEQNNANDHNDD